MNRTQTEEMQNLLDRKAAMGFSFSVVGHLRWDLKQIFELAVAEGFVQGNTASLLFVFVPATPPLICQAFSIIDVESVEERATHP
jgi:hypothetical protein